MTSVWKMLGGLICVLCVLQSIGVDAASVWKRSEDGKAKIIRKGDELILVEPGETDPEEEANEASASRDDSGDEMVRIGDQLILVKTGQHPPRHEEGGTVQRRSAVRDQNLRWTDKTIPYTFDVSYSAKDKKLVKDAMDEWQRHTCLTFRPAKASDKHKIRYVQGDGCFSFVGMVEKTQDISLDKDGCRYVSTALHEIGHALGLYHTQVRPDRDQFVKVDLSDVAKNLQDNFIKETWKNVHHYGVDYDFKSIMHYDGTSFTSGGGTSIKTLNPKWQKIIGNVKHLSFGDFEMMNKMYKCKPAGCTLQDSDCPGVSFVDKTCKCVCPGTSHTNPLVPCTGTGGSSGGSGNKTPVTQKPATQAPTSGGGDGDDGDWWNSSGDSGGDFYPNWDE